MYSYISSFIIIVLIIYIYYIQFRHGNYPKIFLDDLIDYNYLKTGDLIVFKAYNNFNSVFIGSYYGHMGIVYIDPDHSTVPMIFEANGIEHMPLRQHHNKAGVFCSPLKDRIQKYKGRAFIKSLNYEVAPEIVLAFKDFIKYCLVNMKYETKIVKSAIRKWLGIEKCHKGTNCGEIVFLSLIKLNLLDISEYDKPVLHHVKWMASLTDLKNGYRYRDPVEIIDHPFNI